ncbi:hypothetical protein ASPWEDRAFT_184111 [Aspergillus wentii DTO 134E9]|uniref:Uncharacterized protein n=1 Tax=Aspergillus wentii DTO 134E9 TaxID=1073089 RepID=A0A1L9RML3_ASPWE|nr:uncharacterized protein ASPWEDRAFT_184111 [Aspergillus wentii DTO 134E9]OJJ36152.1 hypothetical protein ASPWEDRAFT_184111 [Aspergillus wentii DTO 134E9]
MAGGDGMIVTTSEPFAPSMVTAGYGAYRPLDHLNVSLQFLLRNLIAPAHPVRPPVHPPAFFLSTQAVVSPTIPTRGYVLHLAAVPQLNSIADVEKLTNHVKTFLEKCDQLQESQKQVLHDYYDRDHLKDFYVAFEVLASLARRLASARLPRGVVGFNVHIKQAFMPVIPHASTRQAGIESALRFTEIQLKQAVIQVRNFQEQSTTQKDYMSNMSRKYLTKMKNNASLIEYASGTNELAKADMEIAVLGMKSPAKHSPARHARIIAEAISKFDMNVMKPKTMMIHLPWVILLCWTGWRGLKGF